MNRLVSCLHVFVAGSIFLLRGKTQKTVYEFNAYIHKFRQLLINIGPFKKDSKYLFFSNIKELILNY